MKLVYKPSDPNEAHLLRHMLENNDIMAFVHGDHLYSSAGVVPVHNLIRLEVMDDDYEKARALIIEWEKEQPSKSEEHEPYQTARQTVWFLAMALFCLVLIMLFGV